MNIYIIGTGVMGSAIAKALAKKGQKVFVYDKTFAKAKALVVNKNIFADRNFENLKKADFVVLAIKPYHMDDVGLGVKGIIKPSAIIVSIATGIKINRLQKIFGHKKIIRTMPNLGVAVGQGVMVWKPNGLNSSEQSSSQKLFNSFTENFAVNDEKLIDAFTAVAGSGPAYFFYFAQGLQKAAQSLGFDKAIAAKIIKKVFSAAALLQDKEAYDKLIQQVASKKGTTERMLKIFAKNRLHDIIGKAAKGAYNRAREISNE